MTRSPSALGVRFCAHYLPLLVSGDVALVIRQLLSRLNSVSEYPEVTSPVRVRRMRGIHSVPCTISPTLENMDAYYEHKGI